MDLLRRSSAKLVSRVTRHSPEDPIRLLTRDYVSRGVVARTSAMGELYLVCLTGLRESTSTVGWSGYSAPSPLTRSPRGDEQDAVLRRGGGLGEGKRREEEEG